MIGDAEKDNFTPEETSEGALGVWQRLNISRDGYTINSDY